MDEVIGIKDLRLSLETHFFNKISPLLKSLKKKYNFLSEYEHRKDIEFYSLISHAININGHNSIKKILERVKKNLNTNVEVSIYLHQSTVFNITCLPRNKKDSNELLIFVSQHFFNNLIEDEQVAIIGHEVSHYLLGHLIFPTREIVAYPFELEEINSLKSDILSWSKACEITADIIGLVANDFNHQAYSTAIIKHFTGLNDNSNNRFNISPIVNLVFEQYDYMANDPFYTLETSTHPLMPLRAKIIDSVVESKLIKNFGVPLSEKEKEKYISEYNNLINGLIKSIYPEMFTRNFDDLNVLPSMALAVALSDGKIDSKEIRAINRMFPGSKLLERTKNDIFKNKISSPFKESVQELIEQSIETGKKSKLTKHMLIPIIRSLLVVAASDDEIISEELETIYSFAKAFNFTRHELIIIIKTHNPIHY